jgi:hypothetical protein
MHGVSYSGKGKTILLFLITPSHWVVAFKKQGEAVD